MAAKKRTKAARRQPAIATPTAAPVSESTQRTILWGFLLIAALLVFWNLGSTCIWEDEGQTAVVAQNILTKGVPAASDGKNLVSIFQDHRDIRDGIYIWQGWLPTYVAAGSIAVFGRNAFGARFPFAAAFVVFVWYLYVFLRKWNGGRTRELWLTIALTLTCVPLLLHARQCRYYLLVPLLNLLMIDAYLRSLKEPDRWKHAVLLMVWATALVNSFFPGAFLLGLALAIDVIRRRPPKQVWIKFVIAAAVVVLVNLPMAWFCRIWDRRFAAESGFDGALIFATYLLRYLVTLNDYFFPLILLVIAGAVASRKDRRRQVFADDLTFLFLVVCVTQLIGFALLSDFPFTRYIIGVTPFLIFFGARSLETLSFGKPGVSWALAAVVMGTNLFHILPLPALRLTSLQNAKWTTAGINSDFLEPGKIGISFARGELKELINFPAGSPLFAFARSIVDPPRGPIDLLVEYFRRNAAPNDRVKIAYGDLPLMFHTDLAIVSTSEVGRPAPEWMVFRRFGSMNMDQEFVQQTAKFPYSKIPLPFPDIQWNNQPDPVYHYYTTPSNEVAPPLAVLKKG